MRLDEYLVVNKIVESRNKATFLIENNLVSVNNIIVNKKNYIVNNNDVIKIIEELKYVSRAGYKLEEALKQFKIDCKDKVVLDIGASTGGFSDVCLQNGAKLIYCLDVGYNQLHPKIKNNKKIINLEKTNIKDLNSKMIPAKIDLVVSDISFISSEYMFKAIRKINLAQNADIISLIKPQFELSPNQVKNGLVNEKYWNIAIDKVKKYANNNNFKTIMVIDSPLKGAKKGNKEFLLWAKNE